MPTIQERLSWGQSQLGKSDTPQLDCEILLGAVLDMSRALLFTHPDKTLNTAQDEQYKGYIQQRAMGQPVALILGVQEFWSMDFKVTEDVLIPRPDTETLVELALTLEHNIALNVADLGTGSGAIACALAKTCPHWQVVATDVSDKSLKVAQENIDAHQLSNVTLLKGAWFEPLQGKRFDLIVSNPPYIAPNDPHLVDLIYEPTGALVAQDNGLSDLKQIIEDAPNYLNQGGLLIVEHGFDQAQDVRQLMLDAGFKHVATKQDLGGNDRATYGYL